MWGDELTQKAWNDPNKGATFQPLNTNKKGKQKKHYFSSGFTWWEKMKCFKCNLQEMEPTQLADITIIMAGSNCVKSR